MQTKPYLVKTQYNREEHPCNYEINNEPSQTVPDQTMSIRTLIERYAQGLPIGGSMFPQTFQDDEEYNDIPDPERMDLHDRMEFAQNAAQELETIKDIINKKQYPKKTRPVGDEPDKGSEATDSPSDKTADGTEAQKPDVENV